MDGKPPLKQIQSSLWSLVPAAGDGKRFEPYIRESRGTDLPKRNVNFIARHSMLEHTFRRSAMVIPVHRILTLVSPQHLRYREVRWRQRNRNAATVFVQPAHKETAAGDYWPLLHIDKRRNPEAIVFENHFEDSRKRKPTADATGRRGLG